jgi:hypothetical protein
MSKFMTKAMNKAMERAKEAFDYDGNMIPICPYCEKDINPASFSQKGGSMFQKIDFEFATKYMAVSMFTNIFFCPHCRKILGISRSAIPPSGSSN